MTTEGGDAGTSDIAEGTYDTWGAWVTTNEAVITEFAGPPDKRKTTEGKSLKDALLAAAAKRLKTIGKNGGRKVNMNLGFHSYLAPDKHVYDEV